MHIRPHATVLTLCFSLAAAAAFARDLPATPPTPSAPATPADSVADPNPPDSDVSSARARMEQARRSEDAARQRQDALRAQMDAARHRLEMAAHQLAALSAQMYGPMMQHIEAIAGPPRVLMGVQLDDSRGHAGALVREVSPGGPAEQAGVRAGDLIVAINGTNVQGQEPPMRVVELLHDVKPGDKVDLKVSRDGKTRDLTVTARPDGDEFFSARQFPELPAMPAMPAMPAWVAAPMMVRGPVADMELARLTPGLGRYFGTDTGVLVVRAPSGGVLGLQDGDVILSIGGRKPIDSSHVIRILSSYDPGEKITLWVQRLHRRIPVTTTVPAAPPMAGIRVVIPREAMLGPQWSH
jgi:C-terminal processing protease CtpA/Prc